MKNHIKIVTFLFLFQSLIMYGQENTIRKTETNIPILVELAFQSKFPKIDPVWFSQFQGRYDNKLVYEARFMFDNRYSAAIFDREANLKAFVVTVETSEIPQKVINYMKNNYPYQLVSEAVMVSRDKNSTFELGIYINNRFTIVVFDKDGNFIKTTLG